MFSPKDNTQIETGRLDSVCKSVLLLIAYCCLFGSLACNRERAVESVPPEARIPAGLPVVQLPDVDLAATVAPAQVRWPKQDLGYDIPGGQFGVRVRVKVPEKFKRPPSTGMRFIICQRNSRGVLFEGSVCRIRPVARESENVAIYEGVCPRPARRDEAAVQVSWGPTCHLARATHVK